MTSEKLPRLTRRSWAALVAAVPLVAQVTPAPANVASPALAVADKAAAEVRKVSDRLSQSEVPMAVEPAFTFHA